MSQKMNELQGTTMRVSKRTVRYIEYLKGLLKVRTGKDYTPDDVIWEALLHAFPEEIEYADKSATASSDTLKS